jgi:phosphoesterase RecJ-like protein
MFSLEEKLQGITSVGISGHVRPDGDCVGSTLGLYNYIIKKTFQKINFERFKSLLVIFNNIEFDNEFNIIYY